MLETRVWSLCWEDPLEKEMATHSSTLAWKVPWTEEPGRLQSMGSQRVGHDWATLLIYSGRRTHKGTSESHWDYEAEIRVHEAESTGVLASEFGRKGHFIEKSSRILHLIHLASLADNQCTHTQGEIPWNWIKSNKKSQAKQFPKPTWGLEVFIFLTHLCKEPLITTQNI